jgi:cell division septal protein FtsQ
MPALRGRARYHPRLIGRFLIGGLSIIAVFLLLKLLANASIFSVKSVYVIGDPKNKVATQIISLSKGQSLLFLDEQKISHQLLEIPSVRSLTFEKSLPSSLTVHIYFRAPVVIWQDKAGSFLSDDQGYLFQSGEEPGLVKVTSPQELKLRQKIDAVLLSNILALIKQSNSTISTISIERGYYQATLAGGVAAFFDPSADLRGESQALQLILEKAKIDGRLPRTVDLRLPKPVVTF